MKRFNLLIAFIIIISTTTCHALPTVTTRTFKRLTPTTISVKDSSSFTYGGRNFMLCTRIQGGGFILLEQDINGMFQEADYILNGWGMAWAPHVFTVGTQLWVAYCDTEGQAGGEMSQHIMLARLVITVGNPSYINESIFLSTIRPLYGIGLGDDICPSPFVTTNCWSAIDPWIGVVNGKWQILYTRLNDPYNHNADYAWDNWSMNLAYTYGVVPEYYFQNEYIHHDNYQIGWATGTGGKVQEAPYYKDGYIYYSVGFSNGDYNTLEGTNGISHLRRALVTWNGSTMTGSTQDLNWCIRGKSEDNVLQMVTTHPDYGAANLRCTLRQDIDMLQGGQPGYWIGELMP